jgi:SpoVK/Ycf46/Vps4 family AAA+-type ATPase
VQQWQSGVLIFRTSAFPRDISEAMRRQGTLKEISTTRADNFLAIGENSSSIFTD